MSEPSPQPAFVGLQQVEGGRARCVDHAADAAVEGEWLYLTTTDVADPEQLERVACEVCQRTLAQALAEKAPGQ